MQPEVVQAVQDWLANAREDIETAVLTRDAEPPKRRSAVYHAQQAAEKALKAYLTLHDQPFDLTHHLLPLLDLCVVLDSDFNAWQDTAELLTPYATRFRYPGPPGAPRVPAAAEVDEAVRQAQALFDFVIARAAHESAASAREPGPPDADGLGLS